MHTNLIMSASALWLLLAGALLTFLPQELLAALGAAPEPRLVALIQVCGAAYLGFAMLNWSARRNLIGGIYSRPVAIGNFLHFVAAALAIIKVAPATDWHWTLVAASAVYGLFAIAFGIVVFRPPAAARPAQASRD